MMLRASDGLTMARSVRLFGSPVRQMTLVLPRLPAATRISSSISTLSLSASTTMLARPLDSLAMANSCTMEWILEFQPRMRVWSDSRTRDLPLRSSSILVSKAPDTMPIRLATMIRPPTVITSISARKPQPASPPIVPGSRVRISPPHRMSMKSPSPALSGKARKTHTSTLTTTTSAMVARPNRPISAMVPRDIQLSNQ